MNESTYEAQCNAAQEAGEREDERLSEEQRVLWRKLLRMTLASLENDDDEFICEALEWQMSNLDGDFDAGTYEAIRAWLHELSGTEVDLDRGAWSDVFHVTEDRIAFLKRAIGMLERGER